MWFKYTLTYFNTVLILLCTIGFLAHSETPPQDGEVSIMYVLDVVVFSFLAIWAFSIGLLITFVQLIYGLVTVLGKDTKPLHKHQLIASLLSVMLFGIIFGLSEDYGVEVTVPEQQEMTTPMQTFPE